MKIDLTLIIDETDSRGLQILEDLELALKGAESLRIRTAGLGFTARLAAVEEGR